VLHFTKHQTGGDTFSYLNKDKLIIIMKKAILAIGLAAFFVLVFGFALTRFGPVSTEAATAMPCDNCYQMASQKDKALENMDGALQGSGSRINPCTGEADTVSTYYDLTKGITQIRSVYGNGDAEGYLGLTRYWVCHSSGTAKVTQRIYGPIWAWTPWGFWLNFPFDDDPSTWVKDKEICNTLN
jgi:hypothetical protein